MPRRVINSIDAYQQDRPWLGFPLAVIYKFGDDQGPYLTALITYYGFLSLFPLLLLMITILGFVLQGDPELQAQVVDSTLAELPIVGSQIRENVHSLKGSGVGLAAGLLVATYGSLGVAGATQNAFNRAWAVPRNERPNPIALRLRSLLLLLLVGVGAIVTTALSGLTAGAGAFGATFSAGAGIAAILLATLVNIGLFAVAFRLLTPDEATTRDVWVGAAVAGIGWQLLQLLGTYYVGHALKGAPETYGVFGLVLGLVGWIYLLAFVVVIAAEINVVAQKRLWPRALLTPFTDRVQLTSADKRAYAGYAESERHKGFEVVDVDFEPPED